MHVSTRVAIGVGGFRVLGHGSMLKSDDAKTIREGTRAPSLKRTDCPGDYCSGESDTVADADTLNRITPDWSV